MDFLLDDWFSRLMEQLPYRLPGLITYLTGIVLALTRFRRCHRPALFVLLGCTMMIALSFFYMIGFQAVLNLRHPAAPTVWYLTMIGISCVDAGSVAFLIWAAFSDRYPYYRPEHFETGGRDDALSRE